jgi:hypothetical protein
MADLEGKGFYFQKSKRYEGMCMWGEFRSLIVSC